jgi:2-polyprenyl-3-methyl-5-hydroxy-6-metoxy-1,4-benzoquinol methylase
VRAQLRHGRGPGRLRRVHGLNAHRPKSFAPLEAALREHYFRKCPPGYLDSAWGRNDLQNHLESRLLEDRDRVIPWLDRIEPLQGARVLEIGCGTGSSTVAMAERGAIVTAVDLDEASIAVARERCHLYGVQADFVTANASLLPDSLRGQPFRHIIFYASLEHMTLEERLAAMGVTWRMLPEGGVWSMIETPNRIWYFDWHTSLLPFFNWLPDELAFKRAAASPRPGFRELYDDLTPEAMLHFLRRGRGVSYHELELVMGTGVHDLVVDWLRPAVSWWRQLLGFASTEARYRRLLRRIAPAVHEAFRQPRLDLAIRKTAGRHSGGAASVSLP